MTMHHASDKRARISGVFTGSSFVQALRSPTRFALVYCKQRYAALKRMYLLSIKAPVLQANKNTNKDIKRARISGVFTGSSFVQALRSPTRFALVYCKQRYAALKRMYLLSIKTPVLQANENTNKGIRFLQDQAITRLHCLPTSKEYVNDMPTSPLMILSLLITANIPAKNIRQFPRNSSRTASHLWKAISTLFVSSVLHFPEFCIVYRHAGAVTHCSSPIMIGQKVLFLTC